jgi:hypothetical protein
MAKATKKSSPVVHQLKSVHVHHLPPAVDLVVGPPEIGGPAEPTPAAVAQAKTSRGNYQLDRATKLMQEIWKDGPPAEMGVSAICRQIRREMTKQGHPTNAIPSRKTVGRALGRYK